METTQILTIVIQIVITYAGAMVGWILGKRKSNKEQEARIDNAIKLLLKQNLLSIHEDYVINRKPITQNVKEQATEIYELYSKEFKGNGLCTTLYNEIMALKVEPTKEQQ